MKYKNASLSSIILCKMSMGCMFLHVVHDFFISIYWRHLHRIRKYVRFMLFLSQKGFCKGKEKNLCLFFHLKYCWFSWLKMQISIHSQFHQVPLIGCHVPSSLTSLFPFMYICHETPLVFPAYQWKCMSKLFKLNSRLSVLYISFCWQDILTVFLLLAEFIVENW